MIRYRYAFIPNDYRAPVVFGWSMDGSTFAPDEPADTSSGLLVVVRRCDDTPTEPPAPYVCPGCFAVGGEKCARGASTTRSRRSTARPSNAATTTSETTTSEPVDRVARTCQTSIMTTPRRYAEGTSVAVEKTRAEIAALLKRHGASAFFSASNADSSMVGFHMAERIFRLEIRVAKPEHAPKPKKLFTNTSKLLGQRERWADDENKRRWRAQLLLIKAKLEMIATGETTIEREFLADMLTPNGMTVGQQALPMLARAYASGTMPELPMFAGSGKP